MPTNPTRGKKGRTPPAVALPAPKRPRRQTLEVFQILAEEGLGGPEGWFSVPWRRGSEHVIWMLRHIYNWVETEDVFDWSGFSMVGYTECEDSRTELLTFSAPRPEVELFSTALRARQLDIARSDGGGHAYNALLLNRWSTFGISNADAAGIVLAARCDDAVGESPRYRRAFKEAWGARCYQAAYALPYLEKP